MFIWSKLSARGKALRSGEREQKHTKKKNNSREILKSLLSSESMRAIEIFLLSSMPKPANPFSTDADVDTLSAAFEEFAHFY